MRVADGERRAGVRVGQHELALEVGGRQRAQLVGDPVARLAHQLAVRADDRDRLPAAAGRRLLGVAERGQRRARADDRGERDQRERADRRAHRRRAPHRQAAGATGQRLPRDVDADARHRDQHVAGDDERERVALPRRQRRLAQDRLQRAARAVARELQALAAAAAGGSRAPTPIRVDVDAAAVDRLEAELAVRATRPPRSPCHATRVVGRRGRVHGDAPAMAADDRAGVRQARSSRRRARCASWRSIASSRAADGGGRPCSRRNQRSRLRARGNASDASARRRASRARAS